MVTKPPEKRRPGRPPMGDKNMTSHRVFMSEEQHEKALKVGNGVLSEGVRLMIDAYPPSAPKKRGRPAKN